MKLSVHIVTCGRLELFKACCLSVAEALPPDCEVVVSVNGAGPPTVQWLQAFGHPAFRWLEVSRESLSRSRNRAFELCQSEIIYCLDDDVVVPRELFVEALKRFESDLSLAVLGGPNLTLPQSSYSERLFGAVMTSFFAAPMVRHRYGGSPHAEGAPASEHRFIFCNFAFRRKDIEKKLRFNEELVSNQENLFLHECVHLGLKTQFSSQLYVFHRRRKDLLSFAKQIFSYGYGRAQQTAFAPRSCHPAFLLPSLAVLLFPILFFLYFPAWLGAVFLYWILSLVGAFASSQARALGVLGVLALVPLTAVVHVCYGLGMWKALLDAILHRGQKGFSRVAGIQPTNFSILVPDKSEF